MRGYYIDLRVKADAPHWPPDSLAPLEEQLHVDVLQWGLGSYEHYLETGEASWLAAALEVGERMLDLQRRGGSLDGGWVHERPYPHTYPLEPPWLSAMAQGQGASLLVRLYRETGDERFCDTAVRALAPLRANGGDGLSAPLGGGRFPEEYPTDPPSLVLNGGIFALFGLYDVARGLDDAEAAAAFERSVDILAANIGRWDLGYWSRYDLFPHPVPNVASIAYHALHIDQLRAMRLIAPRAELDAAVDRFEGYRGSGASRLRALGGKALFRLLVPRQPWLARRVPWRRRS